LRSFREISFLRVPFDHAQDMFRAQIFGRRTAEAQSTQR
jgi:hypothetical protein